MLLYKEKHSLIYKLHPLTSALLVLILFVLSIIFTHPVYLLGLLVIIVLIILDTGNLKEWKEYLRFTLPMITIIILVNALFINAGATVLYIGPRLPLIGRIRITLEAIAYGAGMGLRLLTIISVFCLYTYIIQPDKFLKLFSRFGNKSVFVLTLSIRLFPLMINDYKRIIEVQKCRGVSLEKGKWIDKAKNMLPIVSVLLLSSLERSFQQAESMFSRGYGSGKRSIYTKDIFRIRDFLIIGALTISLILGIVAFIKGDSFFIYYPRLSNINYSDLRLLLIISLFLALPVLLDWGWKKWEILRLKI